jgi:hypothetical protein
MADFFGHSNDLITLSLFLSLRYSPTIAYVTSGSGYFVTVTDYPVPRVTHQKAPLP